MEVQRTSFGDPLRFIEKCMAIWTTAPKLGASHACSVVVEPSKMILLVEHYTQQENMIPLRGTIL